MADLSSSRTLGKIGAAETARLAKLKADSASLRETRKALLKGAGVSEPIVSADIIGKVPRKKVIAKVATSVKPSQAGGKRPASAGI